MKKTFIVLLLTVFAFSDASAQNSGNRISTAKSFITLSSEGKYDRAYEYFSDETKANVPLNVLRNEWLPLNLVGGKF